MGTGPRRRAEPVTTGHRTLVYCEDYSQSGPREVYGWWCRDCPEIRDAKDNPTTKANAERDAKKHQDRERAKTA